MGNGLGAGVRTAVDAWKRQPEKLSEKLPELAPNQPIYYLVRGTEGYSVESGIYVGKFKDFHSHTERAALTMQSVHNPADFMRARQEQEARRAGHDVVPGQAPIVLDKHDAQILEHSQSARLPDTRRMNPSKGDLSSGLQKKAEEAALFEQKGMLFSDIKSSIADMQRAATDLQAGNMTPEAYAVVVDLAMATIQTGLGDRELRKQIAEGTQPGWPYAVEALRVIETALEKMNTEITAYLEAQKEKIRVLEARVNDPTGRAKSTFHDHLDLQSLYGSAKYIEERRDAITSPLGNGRDTVALTLGKLLTAAAWYQESNPQ